MAYFFSPYWPFSGTRFKRARWVCYKSPHFSSFPNSIWERPCRRNSIATCPTKGVQKLHYESKMNAEIAPVPDFMLDF
jgi:hypothetical protein